MNATEREAPQTGPDAVAMRQEGTVPRVRQWYQGAQGNQRSHASVTPWYHEQKNADDRRALARALRDQGWTYSAIALVTEYAEHTVTNYSWFPPRGEKPSGRVLEALSELLSACGWFAYRGNEYRPTGIGVSIEGSVKDAVRRGAGHPGGCRPIAGKEQYASVVAKLNVDVNPLRTLDDAILALESCPATTLRAARDCLVVGLKDAANGIRASIEASEVQKEL